MKRVPLDVVRALSALRLPDDARAAHDAVEKELRNFGWNVEREVRVLDRGDGRPGRIDLHAWYKSLRFFVEIDRKTPRRRSLLKLRGACGPGIVVLRSPYPGMPRVVEVDQGVVT